MKNLKTLLFTLLTLSITFSCQKEDIKPNFSQDENVVENTNKIHNSQSENTLEFVFWISNENVNGTIEIQKGGSTVKEVNISDLDFEDKQTSFGTEMGSSVTVTLELSQSELNNTDTHFYVQINTGREVYIHNENYINGEYMFLTNSRNYLEPSFNSGEGSSLTTNAWVVFETIQDKNKRNIYKKDM
jgi:hypothetical protein